IRDKLVTGVQTCALPIYLRHDNRGQRHSCGSTVERPTRWQVEPLAPVTVGPVHKVEGRQSGKALRQAQPEAGTQIERPRNDVLRSEERRVGKECTSRVDA